MNAASWRYRFLLLAATALASCGRFTPKYSDPAPGSYETRMYRVQIGDSVRSIQGAEVTREFFQSAGAQPLLGRFFVDADEGSSTAVVVVGHGFWTERFASSPEVIGRSIEIDGRRATVVGVGPPGFEFPEGAELWTPRARARPTSTSGRSVEHDDAYVISGRVEDPLQLQPEGLELRVGSQTELGGFSSAPVPMQPDGSFATAALEPSTYVLELVRTPHSATKPATTVGFTIVPLTTGDVGGVTVTIRPDTAIDGRFRMVSDNPAAGWPSHIVVNAFLALDGAPLLDGVVAEGASGGRFLLRNAFGPRVLRAGYSLAGDRWWPARVLLDGRDVTNVPTDFSAHERSRLEVEFTQHPARIAGSVEWPAGEPAGGAWVVVGPADPALRQPWAVTSEVTRANPRGAFDLACVPGRYLVRAFPATAFRSGRDIRNRIPELIAGGAVVELGERERTVLRLAIDAPGR